MTKTELEQYIKLKKEVLTIQRRIDKLEGKNVPVVAGKVQSSMDDFPYMRTHVTVQMYEPGANDAVNKAIDILNKRLDRCNAQMVDIEQFIDKIPDSELRNIFHLRYIEGMKLKEIAAEVNEDLSGIGKKITAYLQLSNNSKKSVI